MQYSTNYEMNKPERADQYNIDHWNGNTDIIDTQMKKNADDISDEITRATNAENEISGDLSDEITRATGAENDVDAFNNVLIVSGGISEQKTVTLPVRFRNGVCCKFIFPNGHNCANSSTYLTLNDNDDNRIPIVVNKHGDLINIPIHTIIENGISTYKCLQPNTVLEMYYTTNYDGSNNPAFVVIGNPVVLSSVDYIIYANGKIGNENIGDIKASSLAKIPYGWLECNGQDISRSIYSELFNKFSNELYDNDPSHTLLSRYGVGDGSTTFNLPDYRECALVGVGSNGTFIIDNTNQAHEEHTLGEFKDDQFQGHWVQSTQNILNLAEGNGTGSSSGDSFKFSLLKFKNIISDETHGVPRIGYVTHGKQIGVTYLIKVL
jgi:hypothetical protein